MKNCLVSLDIICSTNVTRAMSDHTSLLVQPKKNRARRKIPFFRYAIRFTGFPGKLMFAADRCHVDEPSSVLHLCISELLPCSPCMCNTDVWQAAKTCMGERLAPQKRPFPKDTSI